VQEVFARGFRRIREGVDTMEKGPRAYFFGIARNIIREHRKPSQRREQQLDDVQWEAQVSKAREAARMEATIALKEYLGRLHPFQAELLVRYCQGEADALMHEYGLSAANLRVTVFRIREQLRAWRDAAAADPPGAGASRNERPAGDMEHGGRLTEET
jgi:DNA-directed RNA polymerase specialized sigma24 family protein